MTIIDLNDAQIEELEQKLGAFDAAHMPQKREGAVHIGIEEDGQTVAGLDATLTAFKILYVSTVFVDEPYRRKGYGTALMREMERRARDLGVNTVRLDTFSWQGKEFYEALGYRAVGHYENADDGYAEYFFVKRLTPNENPA